MPYWLRCILLIQEKYPNNEKINELLTNETQKISNNTTALTSAKDDVANKKAYVYMNETKLYTHKLLNANYSPQLNRQRFNIKAIDIVNVCDDSDTEKDKRYDIRNETDTSNQLKESLEKMLKLMKRVTRILERTLLREKNINAIYDDWKEVASRIDLVLFLIAGAIVIFTPIGLFGKFFTRDETFKNVNHTCECRER